MDCVNIKEINSQSNPQCQFFVVRKKRLCRMTVRPGRNYCGEHEPEPTTKMGKDDSRVPCPNDPKHTCYASKILKHLTVCNARQQQGPDYIMHNINAPLNPDNPPRKLLSQIPQHKILALIEKVNILYDKYVKDNITSIDEHPIHAAVLEDFQEVGRTESSLRHLRQASSLLHLMEAENLVQDSTCYVELGAGKGHLSYYAYRAWCRDRASRVLLVDRASLRHKRDNKLRDPRTTHKQPENSSNAPNVSSSEDTSAKRSGDMDRHTTTNISANDGIDNYSTDGFPKVNANGVADASTKETSVVGKSITDNDVEITTATDSSSADGVSSSGCSRIRADLAHLALEKVPEVAQCEAVVGFAKHLCGAATDYALRCLTAGGVARRLRGAALATCCHHRCDAATYVGADHLREMGIDAEDLNIMFGVVSWATCGDGRSRERRQRDAAPAVGEEIDIDGARVKLNEDEGGGLSVAERGAAGRRAKALLDAGRAQFLRRRGLAARLCRFVPPAVSPENVCILAHKM